MSKIPFGFNPQDFGDDFPFNPESAGELFSQLGNMISSFGSAFQKGESINTSDDILSEVIALALKKYGDDHPTKSNDSNAAQSACSLANVWLNDAVAFPENVASPQLWSPHEWISSTADTWLKLCSPMHKKSTSILTNQMPEQMDAFTKMLSSLSEKMNAINLINQLGSALAEMAGQTYTSTDNGLRIAGDGSSVPTIIPLNIRTLAKSSEIPEHELLVFMMVREVALQRLHNYASWLNPFFSHILDQFANETTVDLEQITSELSHITIENPEDIESIQETLLEKAFNSQNSEEQKKYIHQIQDMLALIAGWAQTSIASAVSNRLPHYEAMSEIIRRNIVTSTGATQILAKLIGIEFVSSRVQEASAFFQYIGDKLGIAERDNMWSHPDLLPRSEEINAPDDYIQRMSSNKNNKDFDDELESLLNDPKNLRGPSDGSESTGDSSEEDSPPEEN